MDDPDAMDIVPMLSTVKCEDEDESSQTIAWSENTSTVENTVSSTLATADQPAKANSTTVVDREDSEIYLTITRLEKEMADLKNPIVFSTTHLEQKMSSWMSETREEEAARYGAESVRHVEPLFARLDNSIAGRIHQLAHDLHHKENELQPSKNTVDSEIQNLWTSLEYIIRSIAHEATRNQLKRHDYLNKSLKAALSVLCPGIAEMYNNDCTQHVVIQAYIWREICNIVFARDPGFWKPNVVNDVKSARIKFLKGASSHEQRCRIALYFSKTHELAESQVEDETVADFATDAAKAAIGFLTKGDAETESRLRNMLDTAVRTALKLDRIFMSSKALLQPRWLENSSDVQDVEVDDERMEVVAGEALSRTRRHKTRFQFSISPFVEKRGNAAGYNYAERMVLCKAKVVLG